MLKKLLTITTCLCLLAVSTAYCRPKLARKKLSRLKFNFCGVKGKVRQMAIPTSAGAPIGRASIHFQPISGGKKVLCQTEADGTYRQRLFKGAYFISVHKDGFGSIETKPSFVRVEGPVTKDFSMKKMTAGFRGYVHLRKGDNTSGPPLKKLKLVFIKKGGGYLRYVTTDANGFYKIWVRPGNYLVYTKNTLYNHAPVPHITIVSKAHKVKDKNFHFKVKNLKLNFKFAKVIGYIWERTGPNKGDELVGPVDFVELTFKKQNSSIVRRTKTKGHGNLYELRMPRGTYEVTLEREGFMMMRPFTYTVDVDEKKKRFDWYMQIDPRTTIK